ncbi:MAG: hypothetical protein IJK67_04960 [Bacilli bacterium]|nr:hypothetical protein [Bacilli bacterium]
MDLRELADAMMAVKDEEEVSFLGYPTTVMEKREGFEDKIYMKSDFIELGDAFYEEPEKYLDELGLDAEELLIVLKDKDPEVFMKQGITSQSIAGSINLATKEFEQNYECFVSLMDTRTLG